MSAVTASAPGKIILFGEHAVVYGEPALAVPVFKVQATATVHKGMPGEGLIIDAVDLNLRLSLAQAATEALVLTARLVLDHLGVPEPDAHMTVRSTIPMASGLGSGAAISAALGRALASYLGHPLEPAELSSLVYEVEKLHHGTPSGIDNTVVCYGQPVYFTRGNAPQTFQVSAPLHLLIADTGIASPTRASVNAVREAWEQDRQTYAAIFRQIGEITRQARSAIESGHLAELGPLMTRNQHYLAQLDVSSPELDALIRAAILAGAEGAKLSGGGRGGNMIAMVVPDRVGQVESALRQAGAVRTIYTVVS